MTDWTLLGTVIHTQVHVDRMVNNGEYEHWKIAAPDRLWLGPDGVIGDIDGRAVLHAHHRLHPNKTRTENTKKFLPNRLLSFGFTGHTDLMAERFGEASVGCAAEDVIVDRPGQVRLADIAGGLQVRRGDRAVDFTNPMVAKPCVPFTKYLLKDQDAADEVVAPNRAFLEEGMRGFLVGLADQTQVVDIAEGDELWARSG